MPAIEELGYLMFYVTNAKRIIGIISSSNYVLYEAIEHTAAFSEERYVFHYCASPNTFYVYFKIGVCNKILLGKYVILLAVFFQTFLKISLSALRNSR